MARQKPPFPLLRRSHPLSQGLALGLPFYEGAGLVANDLSGNGNTASATSGVWTGGQHGWAVNCAGGHTWNCGNGPSLQFGGGATSAAVWAMSGSTPVTTQYLYSKYDGTGSGWAFRASTGGQQAFVCYIGGAQKSVTSSVVITNGVWHHLAFTYDGATIRVYTDGSPDGTLAAPGSLTPNTATALKIGAGTGTGWAGSADSPVLYSRGLSAAEIAQLYADPFAMYRPPAGRIEVVFLDRRLLAPRRSGVFSLSGSPAALKLSRVLPASPGVFGLTGSPASLALSRRMPVAPGSFTLDGSPAALAFGRVLPAAPGAFSWAGYPASLTLARVLAAGAGSFRYASPGALLIFRSAGPITPGRPIIVPGRFDGPLTVPGSFDCPLTVPGRFDGPITLTGSLDVSISGQRISLFRGEDVPIVIPIAGAPTLAGMGIIFTVFNPDGSVLFEVTPTPDSPAVGSLSLTAPNAGTEPAEAGTSYTWEAWRPVSGQRRMACNGPLTIKERLTPLP